MKTECVSKCAEILRIDSGNYVFLCYHCAVEFKSSIEIIEHIETHFQASSASSGCASTQLQDVDDLEDSLQANIVLKHDYTTENKHTTKRAADPQLTPDANAKKTAATNGAFPHKSGSSFDVGIYDNCSLDTSYQKIIETKSEASFRNCDDEHLHDEDDEDEYYDIDHNLDEASQGTRSLDDDPAGSSGQSSSISGHNGMIECKTCGVHVSGRTHFRLHLQTHANLKPHKCDVCGRGFNMQSALKRHYHIHDNEKPEDVQMQRDKLLSMDDMKSPLTNAKLTCDVCGLVSANLGELNTHMDTHATGEPCVCRICDASFDTHSELHEHRRNHKGNKSVQCKLCSQSFFSASILETHMKTHAVDKPNKCDICGRTYVKRYALEEHKRTHTGEKPFSCFVCGKAFARKVLVRQHERIHTGETPFKCRYCDFTFTYGASRRAHERNKHPEM